MDIAGFRERYPAWLEQARALLEAKNWTEAFKSYPFPVNTEAPWTPLAKALAQCRVAVLTTAGLYRRGEQPPFRAEDIEGDWSLRELPLDADPATLAIAHTHFDHARAEADLNTVYPLERLRELVQAGFIGDLAPTHFSISGYCTRPDLVSEHTAPQVVQRLRMERVDALLHIPV
jgi:D-proline reductase (dithiol) PrdB